jgi:hypothetical protein
MRDHTPTPITNFNGWWKRGSEDEVPLDHFTDCENIKFIATSSFGSRDGIGLSQNVLVPLENIKRIYNYATQSANTLILLAINTISGDGEIFHIVDSTTVYGPLLTISGMSDFAFQAYAGRGYISPFAPQQATTPAPNIGLIAIAVAGAGVTAGLHQYASTFVTPTGETTASPLRSVLVVAGPNQQVDLSVIPVDPSGVATARNIYRTIAAGTQLKLLTTIADNVTTTFSDTIADGALGANAPTLNTAIITGSLAVDRGLQGEFLYVYNGDGTAARKAAGAALTGGMTVANGVAGFTDAGVHVFGFVSETDTGYLSPPGLLTSFATSAALSVSFGSVDASPDPHVVKRHLVASLRITGFNGDLEGYDLFFVPNATIENNTDLFLNNISFYDADLLEDASHLFDNYSEIPAGATLGLYHNSLCVGATYNDISLVLVSKEGEPEAISQIDGLIIVTLDGNPITNLQEMRDVLYIFKRARTVSFTDNGDAPSSWPETVVDNALGTPVHGIATVLDSGSNSVDFLIVCTYAGVTIFNGKYQMPELSWKIEKAWKNQDRFSFSNIQIVNAPIQHEIYIVLPDKGLLVGNYSNGMDSKKMRWTPWSCIALFNTVAIVNIDEIIFGSDRV